MRLYIVRHGQTEENKKNIVQGHHDGHLSGLGKEQAKKLAQRLRSKKIDVIYSSDLGRAKDTADYIAKFHPNTPLILTKKLREIDHGAAAGKYNYEFDWDNRTDRHETLRELSVRAITLNDVGHL